VKFCPECGSELPVGTLNFCSTCGTRLWQKESKPVTLPMNQNELSQSQQSGPTIYIQGLRLEDMVEQLLKKKGFETSKREKLRGRSGATHEIDVLAKKTNQTLAVECKNYGEARIVGMSNTSIRH
jgi:Restriction endonuclease